MKKIKMTFSVVIPFEEVIDDEEFQNGYKGDILKLCKFMVKHEGVQGWYDEPLKLESAKIC